MLLPSSQRPKRHWLRVAAGYAALIGLWILPPVLLVVPTVAAGGRPAPQLMWPVDVIAAGMSGHGVSPPWQWVGAAAVLPDPGRFWMVLAGEVAAVLVAAWIGMRMAVVGPAAPGSSWARLWDLWQAGLLARTTGGRRLALGRVARSLVAGQPGVSVLVFGPTGSGKTAGLCIPHVLEWDGPVVAISIKNDLVLETAGARQRRGRTDVYDPSGITGLATCTWSPIDRCQDWDRAMRVGQWLVQGQGGAVAGNPEWEHWEDAAIRLVACGLYAGASLDKPITDALKWLDDGTGQQLGAALGAVRDRDPRAVQWYRSVQERPERERGSCYSTSQKVLRAYIERPVAESAQDCTFDVRRFLTGGSDTLYLVAPQSEQERLSGIFSSLIMTVMSEAADIAQASPAGCVPRPLLVMLDECANTAPIRALPQYLSTMRSVGVTLVAVFQDVAQCEARYRDLAGSVVNNARAVLFLGGGKDRKTLELMRDLTGKQRKRRYMQDNRGLEQVSFEMDEMMPLESGRRLRPGRALLVYGHLPPALLTLRNCYQDQDLVRHRHRFPFYPGIDQVSPSPAP
jgi:type IV secretion system protein VirD4